MRVEIFLQPVNHKLQNIWYYQSRQSHKVGLFLTKVILLGLVITLFKIQVNEKKKQFIYLFQNMWGVTRLGCHMVRFCLTMFGATSYSIKPIKNLGILSVFFRSIA